MMEESQHEECFVRSAALLGAERFAQLKRSRVLVVGVGGVGGWCAEALVRTGLGAIALLDGDRIAASNVNRQCPATPATVGEVKVAAMAARLKAINPKVRLEILAARYPDCEPVAAERLRWLQGFDLVVDAIDSVADKAQLWLDAAAAGVPLLSSLGAANRLDPTRVEVRPFAKVEGDGLARALRQRFRRLGEFPSPMPRCVCSTEPPILSGCDTRGSAMPVTATFGLTLAAEALRAL